MFDDVTMTWDKWTVDTSMEGISGSIDYAKCGARVVWILSVG